MISPTLTIGSFLVAIMVGLTGMGGGALLTPMLMLVFGVPPLAAVSSDLVASAVTKPVGALVHLRRGAVCPRLAGWLSAGSVPGAFAGGLIGWWLGPGSRAQALTAHATGVVLLAAAAGIVARFITQPAPQTARRPAGRRATPAAARARPSRAGGAAHTRPAGPGTGPARPPERDLAVRKLPTVLIGLLAGLAVGITSTGSGTLVIAALAALYPALPAGRLVGTDLAQAAPMVLAAALAHLLAGEVHMTVTEPLLLGGVPGVIVGSLLASRVPGGLVRPALSVLILASGLSLLGLSSAAVALAALTAAAALGGLVSVRRGKAASARGGIAGEAGTGLSPGTPARSSRAGVPGPW